MATFNPKDLLGHIVALSLNFGASEAMAAVARIPHPIVTGAIEEFDDRLATVDHRKNALTLLAGDPRATVRMEVARNLWTICSRFPEHAEDLLHRLARDQSVQVRTAAEVGLSKMIDGLTPAGRIELICNWSLSPDPLDRLALAHALCNPFQVPFADVVIEHLALDAVADVREAAAEAAMRRFSENTYTYAAVLAELVRDPATRVSTTARSFVASLARLGFVVVGVK